MFNLFGKIFGSDSVVNKAMGGIDALVFTEQERSEHKMQMLKLYEPFKLAQRLLALMFSFVFLFVFLIAIGIWIQGVYTTNIDDARYLMEVSKELAEWNIETLGLTVTLIMGFYFGGGMIESSVLRYKEKK